MTTEQTPVLIVLHGARGDLARRMVYPGLAELARAGLLPERWLLLGTGRRAISDDDLAGLVRDALGEHGDAGDAGALDGHVRYAETFTEDDPGDLVDAIAAARRDLGDGTTVVHYLAVPPSAFAPITRALRAHDLASGARVVYEKPYGTSPESFQELDDLVHEVLDEDQVFRIDHFLGKEATQNLHVLRFANELFGGVWNREHVAQVQVDVPETLDVADRADFYDATGAALDMLVSRSRPRSRWSRRARSTPRTWPPPGRPSSRGSARWTRCTTWCWGSSRGTGTWTAWPTTRPPTRSSRRGCGSTTTGGAACRSCCGPASGSRRRRSA